MLIIKESLAFNKSQIINFCLYFSPKKINLPSNKKIFFNFSTK